MKKVFALLVLGLGFQTGSAFAQNLISLSDDPGALIGGQTVIEATWTDNGATSSSLQFDIQFDNAAFTFNNCAVQAPYNAAPYFSTCAPVGNVIRFTSFQVPTAPIASGNVIDVTFDVNGPVGSYQMTVAGIVTNDGQATNTDPGLVEIVDVPSPTLGSAPQAPGQTIDFGDHGTADPDAMATLMVSNVGDDEPLTGSCFISNSAGGVFTLAGDPVALNLNIADPALELDLTCVTSMLGTFNGQLQCDHNGSNGPSSTWPLLCEVLPVPTYDSIPGPGNPLPDMNGTQGNGDVMASTLAVSNVGEAGSLLTGSCSMVGGTTITIPNGNFSVADGAQQNITLVCDDAAEGTFMDTVSCLADPNTTNPGPHTYPVTCNIGPPDPGMFGSNPPSGGIIDLTPGGPVPEGTDLTNAAQLEVFNDGTAGDENIDYNCTITGGSPEITQSPSPALGTLVAGGASDIINYSCDTTANGSFSATVECAWSAPLEGTGGTEMYTATCEVRDAFSDVVETPASGTPVTAEIGAGESITGDFNFEETIGEGLDGSLDTCSLVTGTDFEITTSTTYPQVIPSGGPPLLVQVTFTDPGEGDTFTDTLNCTYTENPDGGEPEQVMVSWPLEVTVVGRNATFRVTKDFDDDNPAGVEVMLECNTGLPLQQQAVIHDPEAPDLGPGDFTFVDFVIVDFEPGTMDCDISESVPTGYSVSYDAEPGEGGIAGNIFEDGEGCHYEAVESADFTCEITNELDIVQVVVNKEWIDDNPEFQLPTFAEITLWCNEPIFFLLAAAEEAAGDQLEGNGLFSATTFIQPGFPGVFGVFPHWDGTTECFVTETPEAGVLQDVSDCESIPLAPGQGGECTVVNTRLYAGIPTLSQYGLILMALLMLGVGAVAFRRYS